MYVVIAHPCNAGRPGDVVEVSTEDGRALVAAGLARLELTAPPSRSPRRAAKTAEVETSPAELDDDVAVEETSADG